MKIVIPGGSGQVGTILARAFHTDGHEVVVLSRKVVSAPWHVVTWDGRTVEEWAREIDGADVVINLAGRSVDCRYTAANLREMMDSRVESTLAVGEAIARAGSPPRVWLQASTATIYAHRFDAANDEATGIIGGSEPGVPTYWKYSIDIATAWERTCVESRTPNTRKVLMRSAITLSPDRGGIFDTLLGLVRRGLGGKNGNGKQFISWIHDHDFVRVVKWLMEHEEVSGVVNLAAPNPLPNAEFMRVLRQAWGARIGLPASEWMLKIGAVLLGTDTELILKSRRVVPGRLLEAGFQFEFPEWGTTAGELCGRWRGAM